MSIDNLDPWFNAIPSSALERLLNPIAEPIGKGLGGVASFIMNPLMKLGIISEQNMNNFEKKIQEKNNAIPIENRDSSKQGLALKALEDSIYQLESERLQNMFSDLISSSLDNRINEAVLPSFSTMLKDMSDNDAYLFNILYELNGVAKVDIEFQNTTTFSTLPVFDNILLFDDNSTIYEPISINTLERLGLIHIHDNSLIQPNYVKNYHNFKNTQWLDIAEERLEKFKNDVISFNDINIKEGYINLTPLGKKFGSVVISK